MIQYLLQKYRSLVNLVTIHSDESVHNERVFLHFNFFYAEKLLRILVFGWLVYQGFLYLSFMERPAELFYPMTYFGRLFMPEFPSPLIFGLVVLTSTLANTYCYFKNANIPAKAILAFGLLYINALQWNYGYFSQAGHLFVLVNLFIVFVKVPGPGKGNVKNPEIAESVKWSFIGFMGTYSISGIWQVIGLVFGDTLAPGTQSWLSTETTLFNIVAGFRSWDLSLDSVLIDVFTVPYIWPILYVGILNLQLFSFLAAVRLPLFYWVGSGTILLHLFNMVFIKTVFIVTPLLILILFFPYHLVFRNKFESLIFLEKETNFSGRYLHAVYTRKYEKGIDVYSGFYAYREHMLDRGKWLAGLLFLPGLSLLVTVIWRIFTQQKETFEGIESGKVEIVMESSEGEEESITLEKE